MSEYRDAKRDQPAPKQGIQNVTDAVIADLKDRTEFGTKKYGRPLETHNGRDALLDAYQEAVDLALYLKQAVLEGKPNKHIAESGWFTKAQADYGGACGGGKSCLLTAKAEADADKRLGYPHESTEIRGSCEASLRCEQDRTLLLRNQIAERDRRLAERDSTIAKLTKQLSEIGSAGVDHWKAVGDRTEKLLTESEGRRTELAGELGAAQDDIRSLRETLTETEKRRMTLSGMLTSEQNVVRGLQLRLEDSEKSRVHVAGELAKVEYTTRSLRESLAESQKLIGELRASIAERDTRITNFAKDVAGYKATIDLAVNDRDKAYKDIGILANENDGLRKDVAGYKATAKRTANERDKAYKDMDVLIRKTETLLAERDAAVKKAASHDKVFSDCSARINDLIGRNDTLREKLAARDKEFESLRVLSSRAMADRDAASESANYLRNENDRLHKRISELTSVKWVVEGDTIRSGNTVWSIESKPGCPISPECGPDKTCPCFPAHLWNGPQKCNFEDAVGCFRYAMPGDTDGCFRHDPIDDKS